MEIVGERSSSKRVSKEHRVQEPKPSNKPVDVIPPPSHRSSRVFHPPERYLDILTEDLEEAFLIGDRDIRNDPKTYDEVMLCWNLYVGTCMCILKFYFLNTTVKK